MRITRPNVREGLRRTKAFFEEHPGILKATTTVALLLVIYYLTTSVVAYVTAPRLQMTMSPVVGRIAVTVEPVKEEAIAQTVTYTGSVLSLQDVPVLARVEGWVRDFKLYEGDRVEKGQPLARLEAQELKAKAEQAKAMVGQAENHIQHMEANILRAKAEVDRAGQGRAQAEANLRRSEAGVHQARASILQARAQVAQAESGVKEAEEATGQARAGVLQARAQVAQAESGVKEAEEATGQARAGVPVAVAALEAARQALAEHEAALIRVRAGVPEAKANLDYVADEFKRDEALFKGGAISGSAFDRSKAQLAVAREKVAQAEAMVAQHVASVANAKAQIDRALAMVNQAQAAVRRAQAREAQARDQVAQAKAGLTSAEAAVKRAQAREAQARDQVRQAEAGLGHAEAGLRMAEAGRGAAAAAVEQAKAMEEETRAGVKQVESQLAGAGAQLGQAKEELQARGVVAGYMDVQAPITGRVTKRYVYAGTLVKPGMPLVDLQDLTKVRVQVRVAEKDAALLKVGTEAVIRFPSLSAPHDRIEARVTTIFPQLEPTTRTTTVEMAIANPGERIKTDMFAIVDLVLQRKDKAITIPREAVLALEGKEPIVYVTDGVTASQRAVKLGLAVANRVEVLEGVKAGEMVVSKGMRNLSEGTQVNVVQAL